MSWAVTEAAAAVDLPPLSLLLLLFYVRPDSSVPSCCRCSVCAGVSRAATVASAAVAAAAIVVIGAELLLFVQLDSPVILVFIIIASWSAVLSVFTLLVAALICIA